MVEEVAGENLEVERMGKRQRLAGKSTKIKVDLIHSQTKNQAMGLKMKSMEEIETQGLLVLKLVISYMMEKDRGTIRLQGTKERKESKRKRGRHIVVEVVEEEEEVVEEEEGAEVVEMVQQPATVHTRRLRRRIDSSEEVKTLTMSHSLKSPPELQRHVLSQGRPN